MGGTRTGKTARGASAEGASAVGARSLGAFAAGAAASGALVIGALAIRSLVVKRARIGRLSVEELDVGRLRVRDLVAPEAREPRPFEALEEPKYANLTTFRKSGEPVPTPVWFAMVDGRVYVQTGVDSGKVKRIRNDPRVLLTPSTPRGKPRGADVEGVARVVEGEELPRARAALSGRYRKETAFARLFGALKEFDGSPTLEIRPAADPEGAEPPRPAPLS